MSYYLGVDLGTTFTAAAIWRGGRVEITNLGNRTAAIPSVVLLRDDGSMLVGEAAARRAAVEPHRVGREFKRRFGDPTPIVIGGSPYSADGLMAKLLQSVVAKVTENEGGPPAGVAVSHPANWGGYKTDLLGQMIRLADLDRAATVTEPEAAAIHYASHERVEPGSVVAVYDLGGGTFDAAVLRKTAAGWDILGEPQGVERLGGIDIDEAVFQHVVATLDGAVEALDTNDATALAAVARLRADCVEAKEALSSDTEASIPVFLPNRQTEVRLTRRELEDMVRPALEVSVTALDRALRTADVEAGEVSAVLLVGGSSRVPLVAELVGSGLGRPVAIDAHPKYSVALGAAVVAAGEHVAGAAGRSQVAPVPEAPSLAATVPPEPGLVAGPAPATVAPVAPARGLPDPAVPPAAPPAPPLLTAGARGAAGALAPPGRVGAPRTGAGRAPGRRRSGAGVWVALLLVAGGLVAWLVGGGVLGGSSAPDASDSRRTTTTRLPTAELRQLAAGCESGAMPDCDRLWEYSAHLSWREHPAETCGGNDPAGGHEGTCTEDFGAFAPTSTTGP